MRYSIGGGSSVVPLRRIEGRSLTPPRVRKYLRLPMRKSRHRGVTDKGRDECVEGGGGQLVVGLEKDVLD